MAPRQFSRYHFPFSYAGLLSYRFEERLSFAAQEHNANRVKKLLDELLYALHIKNEGGGRYEAYTWDKDQVTKEYYEKYVMEMSPRNKRSLALQSSQGRNTKITAGLTLVLQQMMNQHGGLYFTNCRVGSGTTTPLSSDTDVQTIIGGTHTVTWPRVVGTTAYWDTFFTNTENLGTVGNAVICTGSPGTLITHFLLTPTITHDATNNMTISYALGVS